MKPRTLLSIHRWIALVFAPLLAMQAVTGGALLFRDDLSAVMEPARISAPGQIVPLSVLAASAENAQPKRRIVRIFLPQHDDGTAFAQLDGYDGAVGHALLDPGNGKLLATGSIWHFPLETALQLHFRLNGGNFGLLLVCLYGFALMLIAATGLWHWWPGRKRMLQALKIPARMPQRLKLRAWHRSSGALLSGVLLVTALTGILTGYPSLVFGPSPASATPIPMIPADIDAAYALAKAEFPASRPRDVRFRQDGTLAINFFAPRGGAWAVDTVIVSNVDQAIVSVTPYEANNALWTYTLPIHTGSIAGVAGRWLMLAAAAGLLFLTISGPLAWWRARKKGKTAQ
ncbi:PepSY-associated TM helix domain-containing protein [Croceicoccus ponticola]|nr:PepSY-associated TM helix domain-containing protein [Croceicoccus ponticola]